MISFHGNNSLYGRFLQFQSIRAVNMHISMYIGNFFLGNSLWNSKNCCFQTLFVNFFITVFRWQPLCYRQSTAFTPNFRKKTSFFLQIHMENTLFLPTTASPITTTRPEIFPLVKIILYYLETLKSFQRSWIHFVSPINTCTVCIHYSNINSVEKFLQRVDKCLITSNEQLTLITETMDWRESRAL